MGKSLSIGPLGIDSLQAAVISHLDSLGLNRNEHRLWTECPEQIAYIDLLNLASVGLFLEHVAKIEGFTDTNVALDQTRFRQLPWWDFSIWLPISFAPPTLLDDGGFPIFLGSCHALLADLEEVNKLSSLQLGKAPRGYDAMRADIKKFYRSSFELDDEASIIQWIWKAIYDGAQIAIEHHAVLFGEPG